MNYANKKLHYLSDNQHINQHSKERFFVFILTNQKLFTNSALKKHYKLIPTDFVLV